MSNKVLHKSEDSEEFAINDAGDIIRIVQERNALLKRLRESEEENKNLRAENNDLKAKLMANKEEFEEFKKESRENSTNLQTQLNHLQEENDKLRAENEKLRKEINEQSTEITRLNAEMLRMQTRIFAADIISVYSEDVLMTDWSKVVTEIEPWKDKYPEHLGPKQVLDWKRKQESTNTPERINSRLVKNLKIKAEYIESVDLRTILRIKRDRNNSCHALSEKEKEGCVMKALQFDWSPLGEDTKEMEKIVKIIYKELYEPQESSDAPIDYLDDSE